MRHAKKKLQLNRFTSWGRATLISLAKNIFIHQSIKTTRHKAKTVKPLIEKLISLGKKNSLSAKRQAYRILGDHNMVSRLFNDIAPRFTNRIGGYTRILDLGVRRGDNARLAILALTEIKEKKPKKIKAETATAKKAETTKEEIIEAKKPTTETTTEKATVPAPAVKAVVKKRPPITKKPAKKFLGGLRNIFKKERDSL